MKYLVINASPHENGGTSKFVHAFTEAAKKVGEVKVLNLHDSPPAYSRGDNAPSMIETMYQREVLACDALFIATPTYWFNTPSILKAFVEEIDGIESMLWQRARALGIAVYAPQGGELGVASALTFPLNHMNFVLVDVGYIFHRGIPIDDWAWEDLALMPERMRRVIGR
ncbi:NAD(P)H-dependent oxidoreductase [Candidatus Kaiserbacteria bacterium]|nr:NAD(P)H-dependent oxidoreductase [Candidatus Kaiserbacteria bacterium]